MSEDERGPCDECSEAIMSDPSEGHRRCSSRDCSCSCREPALDLSKADDRLRAAIACRAALAADLASSVDLDDRQALSYISAIVADRLQEEMDRLMGVASKEAPSPVQPVISESDLVEIRELTEMLPALRLLLRGGHRQVPPPSLPPPPQDPEEDDAGIDSEESSAQPQKRQPKVEKQKPRDMRTLRRGGGGQPMPSPGAMHHVTMAQASVASQMGSMSFEKVRTGAASSSGNTER
ncbi:MAG: hypothetical protein E6Q97_24115 [Desulfurellales bacterium]|nr:MAG: hypothetical protein E6Q97_24115 [Desulfurellales bacterium]